MIRQQMQDVQVILYPHVRNGLAQSLETQVTLPHANYKAGEVFDAIPNVLASCSCARYDNDHIHAQDERGDVPISIHENIGPFGPQHSYGFARSVSGQLTLSYEVALPAFDGHARNPGFQACCHDHGLTGAGVSYLLLPEGTHRFHIHMDLSEYPPGAYGIAGCHKGDYIHEGTAHDLKFIYYALGCLSEYHQESSKLHVYTIDEDMRYMTEVSGIIGAYYDYMERFFHDGDEPYQILLYPTRRTLLTGTALTRCCYMGFGADFIIKDLQEVEDVIAHELTHNWCAVAENAGCDDSLCSLYAEATAEYYSSAMLYRTERHGIQTQVDSINAKLRDYYSNPFREGAYKDVYSKSWTHAYAQRIPYNRGIIMLMRMDYAIRKRSHGDKSLDDVVLQIVDAANSGKVLTWSEFLTLADAECNEEATVIANEILAPGLLLPPADYFGPDYHLIETRIPMKCEGFDYTVRYESDRRIHGLIPGSNAEIAGLRNGDIIVSLITDGAAGDPAPLSHCVYQRDGQEYSTCYIATGEEVSCWQYVPVAS